MKLNIAIFALLIISLNSCIENDYIDDFVEPVLRINNPIDTLGINESYQFSKTYFNNVGLQENIEATWESSNENVISISQDGLAQALSLGNSLISVTVNSEDLLLTTSFSLEVGSSTAESIQKVSGVITTTSSYVLEGDFIIQQEQGGIAINIADNYRASTALPGLFIYLSNNPNSVSGALEIGPVEVFNGAHSYQVDNVSLNDFSYLLYFCKPFNIKVGDGRIE